MRMVTYGNPSASVVLIQMVDEHDLEGMDSETAEIQKLTGVDFCLLAIKTQNWNHDLSPWYASAVFGKEDFGNGADEALDEVLKACTDQDKTYILGGYSLAGLFSLWAAYLWFPGFLDYMRGNSIHAGSVYLSLGDKEEKARNAVLCTVGDRIREAYGLLKEQGISTTLEWNQGNHFKDPDIRMAKAFAWVMKRM